MADSNFRAYELGKTNPKIETLERIAKALDVSLSYLLGLASVPLDDTPILETPQEFLEFYDGDIKKAYEAFLAIGEEWEEKQREKITVDRIAESFPNAEVSETEEKIRIQIIKPPDEVPDSDELRRNLLLKKYDSMNPRGKLKVLDYAVELYRLPEYRKSENT